MKNSEQYVFKNNKRLRKGYTTGLCAKAAASAALHMLLGGQYLNKVAVTTPKNVSATFDILDITRKDGLVSCAVKKDSGDDPDITNKVLIYAKASFRSDGLNILTGGIGIGKVTKPGLGIAVGDYAINKTPKAELEKQLSEITTLYNCKKGITLEIYIPTGESLAKKTFNPRLGIVGGLSILGTTGIIEPMSDAAVLDSIKLEMKMLKENGIRYIVLTPGNYGETFLADTLNINAKSCVKIGNFFGESIDYAHELGFTAILIAGHIGKMVKLAGGIMNTHSKWADCRMEILCANAGILGANTSVLKSLMDSPTTDKAIEVLKTAGLDKQVMSAISEKIDFHIKTRTYHETLIEAIFFSNVHGVLGSTKNADTLIKKVNSFGG